MDIVFSVFAWVSVVLFQAVVHYSFARKPKKKLTEQAAEEEEEEETEKATHDAETAKQKLNQMPQRAHLSFSVEEDDANEMDGDEPQVFYELLSQTGSEMARVSQLYYVVKAACCCCFAAE